MMRFVGVAFAALLATSAVASAAETGVKGGQDGTVVKTGPADTGIKKGQDGTVVKTGGADTGAKGSEAGTPNVLRANARRPRG